MFKNKIKLAIVGVGKIVLDQHLPSINKNSTYDLVATASRNASIDGVEHFSDIQTMLDRVSIDAVALCMPPQYRYAAAQTALLNGKHVLLEKPPGATVSEVDHLVALAKQHGVSLYATWHSRHAAAVELARHALKGRNLKKIALTWKEDVRKWHPGQEWIWQVGGLGVFDPGINGISILTHCLNTSVIVTQAHLEYPDNKAAPIAAKVGFKTACGADIEGQFDWRVNGNESWSIDFHTEQGLVQLTDGGARLLIDGIHQDSCQSFEHDEYEAIYAQFADIILAGKSDVDLTPLKLVADAFLLGDHQQVEPFIE